MIGTETTFRQLNLDHTLWLFMRSYMTMPFATVVSASLINAYKIVNRSDNETEPADSSGIDALNAFATYANFVYAFFLSTGAEKLLQELWWLATANLGNTAAQQQLIQSRIQTLSTREQLDAFQLALEKVLMDSRITRAQFIDYLWRKLWALYSYSDTRISTVLKAFSVLSSYAFAGLLGSMVGNINTTICKMSTVHGLPWSLSAPLVSETCHVLSSRIGVGPILSPLLFGDGSSISASSLICALLFMGAVR